MRVSGRVGSIKICNVLLDVLAKACRMLQNFSVLGWWKEGVVGNGPNSLSRMGSHVSAGCRNTVRPSYNERRGGWKNGGVEGEKEKKKE